MTEDSKDALSLSDDEEDDEFGNDQHLPELTNTLCKWTNYIHGWQSRYIVLKEGTLSYYKSENETAFGCRGAVSLAKADIMPHEFDECRFDVSVNDCLWYLRTEFKEDRRRWIDALELHKQAESGYGSENSLRRHGSMMSLASAASLSTTSTSSFKRGRGLREKLAEMETFRDILCRQVDTLQSYFDACAVAITKQNPHDSVCTGAEENDEVEEVEVIKGHKKNVSQTFIPTLDSNKDKDIQNILQQHGAHAIDFKGEAFTFKATTAGILATLSHCIELMGQREEAWRKRLERENEKRKKVEEAYMATVHYKSKPIVIGGPDYEEGPHSMITEDEFFDAIDATLDKMDKEELRPRFKSTSEAARAVMEPDLDPTHTLYKEIKDHIYDHVVHADMTASDVAETWQLIAEDGEMKVYKRELEEDGLVIDPIKAIHTIKGVTGHEMCHHFWDPSVRMEWDTILESSTVIEWLSKSIMVTHQSHRRVWPSTQRDSLFWSAIDHYANEDDDESPDYWAVVNHSTEHDLCPITNKAVRMRFNIAMICQTVVNPPENGQPITRDNLSCKIQYCANINPGGWAPASVIRVISKREVPKFLKTFTQFVQDKTKGQPIMF